MGKLASIERTAWQVLTGSSSWNYEQALWRPTRQPVATVAEWSDTYGPDPEAGAINRRAWQKVGVVAVRGNHVEKLLAQDNVDPAVAFTMGERMVVGTLERPGFSYIGSGESRRTAHGLRIGNGETQFSIGIVNADGTFISPPHDTFDCQGPINISDIGVLGSGYQELHFS
jgi:hypothetical protein